MIKSAGLLPISQQCTCSVDERLEAVIGALQPARLRSAVAYGVAGGKRVRPLLAMLAAAASGGRESDALDAGVALELLHSASLVHDDIMDQARLRRGRPALHDAFDLSTAILAGDAMIALAFRLIQGAGVYSVPTKRRNRISGLFSEAFVELCEGQAYDLAAGDPGHDGRATHRRTVEKKTARLVAATMAIGALHVTDDPQLVPALESFGFLLGLAYQAQDDLLDARGHEETVGKSVGIDVRNGRTTYLTLAYPHQDQADAAIGLVRQLTEEACEQLRALPPTDARQHLASLAASLAEREA